jgi:hypothetical protein
MGGDDKDGQCGRIINPSWVLLPSWLFMRNMVYNKAYKLNITVLFCNWGRGIKLSFYFSGDTAI